MNVIPFVIVTILLTFFLGVCIANLEKNKVMNNWASMRCEIPVIFAGSYFKPQTDPRTTTQFASDNFQFCMKELVENVFSIAIQPLLGVFSSHVSGTSVMSNILADVRNLVQIIYTAFLSYMKTYFTRFEQVTYQFSRIFQHLRMAMRRVNTMVLDLLFMGLTIVRGILNTIDFFIVVVMVILAILLALMILLWFVMFPFMGVIMAVIVALIVATMGATIGGLAHMQSAFCFKCGTLVVLDNGETIPIEELKLNDTLHGGSRVISIIKTVQDSPLYNLYGVHVAGSHNVKTDQGWTMVFNHKDAIKTDEKTDCLYCLNTTTQTIPVMSSNGILSFKDWEEFENDDVGNYIWNYKVLQNLNNNQFKHWHNYTHSEPISPYVSNQTIVNKKEQSGYSFITIDKIKIGDFIYDGYTKTYTEVLGTVSGIIDQKNTTQMGDGWVSSTAILWDNPEWKNTFKKTHKGGGSPVEGTTLITKSGSFSLFTKGNTVIQTIRTVRDFMEVGYNHIHTLYSLIDFRLSSSSKNILSTKVE